MTHRIQVTTRFDITATGVRSHYRDSVLPWTMSTGAVIRDQAGWNRARNQQRNWETMNQIISLRCLPERISEPRRQDDVWTFEFDVPNLESVAQEQDPVGWLRHDATGVPMITGLDERPVELAMLQALGAHANTWFELLTDK